MTVRVRTLQAGTESKSWQVFYMPRIFEASTNATPDLFPQLSSPTEETLVPGRYVMWVRDPATARLGERTVVKVGEGRMQLLLDLSVPATPRGPAAPVCSGATNARGSPSLRRCWLRSRPRSPLCRRPSKPPELLSGSSQRWHPPRS